MALSKISKWVVGIASALVVGSSAFAQGNPAKFQKVDWGVSGCNVKFGDEIAAPTLQGFIDLAETEGAYAFTHNAKTQLGKLITAPFPASCRPAPSSTDVLYIAQGAVLHYKEQDFGFNGCDVKFTPDLTDIDVGALKIEARDRGAIGFTIHPNGTFGAIIVGDYPTGCKSAKGLSWPLYLADGWDANYKIQDFGFNGCPVKFGPSLINVTRQQMNVAAKQWGAPGFGISGGEIKDGGLLRAPYPFPCKSGAKWSWHLYLQD